MLSRSTYCMGPYSMLNVTTFLNICLETVRSQQSTRKHWKLYESVGFLFQINGFGKAFLEDYRARTVHT